MRIKIVRLYQTPIHDPKQTEGELYIIDDRGRIVFECKTLELPWLDNKFRISCIPAGAYIGYKHVSPNHGDCIWIKNVDNRTEILIHVANFIKDLLGCIGVGENFIKIDSDNLMDLTNSKATLDKILALIDTDEIPIEIVWR